MALTRKMLAAMEIPAEKIDEIIAGHVEVVNGLKEELEKCKGFEADSKELAKVKAENEELKKVVAERDELKGKYEKTKTEFDDYKKDQETKAVKAAKESAYRKLLKDANISEKRMDSILKVSGDVVDKLELDDDGNIKNSEELTKSIKDEWSDFVQNTRDQGAKVSTPPDSTGTSKPESRAAQLEAKYHASIYGAEKASE